MGMDVYGKNATDLVGGYFRRNVWGWRPLWDYCVDTFEVASKVRDGHSNSGHGLNAKDSFTLSEQMKLAIANGTAEEYIAERNEKLSNLDRPTCKFCDGTGIRTDEVGVQTGQPERELSTEMSMLTGRTKGWCNGCAGEGKTDNWETNYYLDLDDIKEFAEFLEHCGGFKIC
jgi:DnaJ-class molecular chaperone